MMEHVSQWLSAYLDGELYGTRLSQVEGHLHTCQACRNEIHQYGWLSSLLQQSPPPAARLSPEQFTARVNRRLTQPSGITFSQRVLRASWWAMPLGLITAWAYIQAVTWVSSIVERAGLSESLEAVEMAGLLDWLGWIGQGLWEAPGGAMQWLNPTILLAQVFGFQAGMTVLLALVLWSWLALWWIISKKGELQWILLKY